MFQVSRKKIVIFIVFAAALAYCQRPVSAQGTLIEAETAGPEYPFSIYSESISVEAENNCAAVHVVQIFRNNTSEPKQASYVFTLPENTISSGYYIWDDGEKLEGVQVFTMPAAGTRRIELDYRVLLSMRGGLFELLLPLKRGGIKRPAEKFSVSVVVNSSDPLQVLRSECADFKLFGAWRNSAENGRYSFKDSFVHDDFLPSDDCRVLFGAAGPEAGAGQMRIYTHKDAGNDGYFALFVNPAVVPPAGTRYNFVFMLDCSASMSGGGFETGRGITASLIKHMPEGSSFGIIAFNEKPLLFQNGPVDASERNRKSAAVFLSNLNPSGGTSFGMLAGVAAVLTDKQAENHFMLITDGVSPLDPADSGNSAEVLKKFLPEDAVVHCIGTGNCSEKPLSEISAAFGGTFKVYGPGDDLGLASQDFFRNGIVSISSVIVDFGNAAVYDVVPERLGNIYPGNSTVITGRYSGACETGVSMRGISFGRIWKAELPCVFPAEEGANSYVADLWKKNAGMRGTVPDGTAGIVRAGTADIIVCPVRIIEPAESPQQLFSDAEFAKQPAESGAGDSESALQMLKDAKAAMDAGRFTEAQGFINKARQYCPRLFITELMQAKLHERLGEFASAETALKSCVIYLPDKADALAALAEFYERRMNFDSAVRAFINLVKLSSNREKAGILRRIIAIYETRHLDEYAVRFYADIAAVTSDAEDYASLADKLFAQKRDSQAIDSMRKAVELARDKESYIRRLFAYFNDAENAQGKGSAERLAGGIELLEKYLQDDPLLHLYGDLLGAYKRVKIEELQATLYEEKRRKIFGASGFASAQDELLNHFQRGQFFLYEGNLSEAVKMFKYCAYNASGAEGTAHIAKLIAYDCRDVVAAAEIYFKLISGARSPAEKGIFLAGLAGLYANSGAELAVLGFGAPSIRFSDEASVLAGFAGGRRSGDVADGVYVNAVREAVRLYSIAAEVHDGNVKYTALKGLAEIYIRAKKYKEAVSAYVEIIKHCPEKEAPDWYLRMAEAQDNCDPEGAQVSRRHASETRLFLSPVYTGVSAEKLLDGFAGKLQAVQPFYKEFTAEWFEYSMRNAYLDPGARDIFLSKVFQSSWVKKLPGMLTPEAEGGNIVALKLLADYYWRLSEYETAAELYAVCDMRAPGNAEVMERIASAERSLLKHLDAAKAYSALCLFKPGQSRWYRLAGECLLESGLEDSARNFLDNAVFAEPGKNDSLRQIAVFSADIGHYGIAVDLIKKARRLWKDSGLCADELGRLYIRTGNYDAAIEEHLGLFISPAGNNGAVKAVDTLLGLANEDNSIHLPLVLENIIEYFQRVSAENTPEERNNCINNIFVFLEKLNRPDAEYSFHTRLIDVIADEDVCYEIADRLENFNRRDLYEYALLKAVSAYPKKNMPYQKLYDFYAKTGKSHAIKELLYRKTANLPFVPESWLELAGYCYDNGSAHEPVRVMEKACEVLPENPKVLAGLARYCVLSGRFTKAAGIYDGLISKYPQDIANYTALAECHVKAYEPEKAEAVLVMLRAMHPDMSAYSLPIAEFYINTGRSELAVSGELRGEEKLLFETGTGLVFLKNGNLVKAVGIFDGYFDECAESGSTLTGDVNEKIITAVLSHDRPDKALQYTRAVLASGSYGTGFCEKILNAFGGYGMRVSADMKAGEKSMYEAACLELLRINLKQKYFDSALMESFYDFAVHTGLLERLISSYADDSAAGHDDFISSYICARLYSLDHRYPEAAFYYKKVIGYAPTTAVFHAELAGLFAQIGNFRAAVDEYELVISLESVAVRKSNNSGDAAAHLEGAFTSALYLGDIMLAAGFYADYAAMAYEKTNGSQPSRDYIDRQVSIFCEENGYFEKAFDYLEKASAGGGKSDRAELRRLVRLAKHAGKFDMALKYCAGLYGSASTAAEQDDIFSEMTKLYLLEDTLPEAVKKYCGDVLDSSHVQADDFIRASKIYITSGNFESSVTVLNRALEKWPGYTQIKRELFMLYISRRQWPEALIAGKQLIRMQAYAQFPDNDVLCNLALACRNTGDLEAAEHYLSSAIDIRPDSAGYYSALGAVLLEQGRYDAAKFLFRRAVNLCISDKSEHIAGYAQVLLAEKNAAGAAEYIANSDPDAAASIMTGLGLTGYARDFLLKRFSVLRERHLYGESREAAAELFRLCRLENDFITPVGPLLTVFEDTRDGRVRKDALAETAAALALCYAMTGRSSDAAVVAEGAFEISGGSPAVYYYMAEFYSDRNPEKSLELFRKAVSAGIRDNARKPEYYLSCAEKMFELRSNDTAVSTLKQLAYEFPQDDKAMVSAGGILMKNGFAGQAGLYYERAVKISPADTGNLFSMLDYLRSTGEYTSAQKYFAMVMQSSPSTAVRNKLRTVKADIASRSPGVKEMLEKLRQGMKKRGLSLEDTRFLAQLYLSTGEVERAYNTCRTIILRHPYDRDTLLILLDCTEKLGNKDESAILAKELELVDPEWGKAGE